MMTVSVSGEAEVFDFKQLCYRYRLRRKDRKEMRCCVMDVVWTFFGGGARGKLPDGETIQNCKLTQPPGQWRHVM